MMYRIACRSHWQECAQVNVSVLACSAVVHMCRADCATGQGRASQRTVAVSYQDAVQVAPGSSAPRRPPTLA
eukprot:scaffold32223_cov107-Isochrysis_galbana.AAC.1